MDVLEAIEDSSFSTVVAVSDSQIPPSDEIEYLEEAITTLESLGCTIVNVTDFNGYGSGVTFMVKYSEFRKVAIRQKLVFLYSVHQEEYNKIYSVFTTSFESIIVGWSIEEKINEDIVNEDYTKFEKVEIQSAICTLDSTGNWTIRLKLKNTGTKTATLISAFVNNLEVNNYNTIWGDAQWNTNMTISTAITSGQSMVIEMYIDADRPGTSFISGTTVNIKLHSAGGMDYIKLVELV